MSYVYTAGLKVIVEDVLTALTETPTVYAYDFLTGDALTSPAPTITSVRTGVYRLSVTANVLTDVLFVFIPHQDDEDKIGQEALLHEKMWQVVDTIKAKTDNLPASPAAVGSAMGLANGAITAAKIASSAITADKIASNAIAAAKIASGAITDAKIANNAITDSKITNDVVTKIQNGLVTESFIFYNVIPPLKNKPSPFQSINQMIVSGAGLDEVNGAYIGGEVLNSRPEYRLYKEGVDTGACLLWTGESWYLTAHFPPNNPYTSFYRSYDDVPTPDLCETWEAVVGDAPVPTVIKGDSISLATSSALSTVSGKVDNIKTKTDNLPATPAAKGDKMLLDTNALDAAAIKADAVAKLQANLALEATLTAIKGAGWAGETLKAIAEAIDSGGGLDAEGVRDAIGLATANLDTQLSAIQSDLDNPSQYKADVSALAKTTDLSGLAEKTDLSGLATSSALSTVDGKVDNIKVQTDKIPATPAPANEYDARLVTIQADLDNPSQYKADISALATSAEVGALNNITAAEVLAEEVIGGYSLAQVLTALAAKMHGLASGAGTTTIAYKGIDGTPNVVVETVDGKGNRSNVVLNI